MRNDLNKAIFNNRGKECERSYGFFGEPNQIYWLTVKRYEAWLNCPLKAGIFEWTYKESRRQLFPYNQLSKITHFFKTPFQTNKDLFPFIIL